MNLKLRTPLYGVGINDADYVTQPRHGTRCPIFDKWHSMLRRCYSENSLVRNPAYTFTIVCEEWLTFSKFKAWMEKQDWYGKSLDKDLLGAGNLYSPETCIFISPRLNSFISERISSEFPGVFLKFKDGRINKYVAQAMLDGKKTHLGCYNNQPSAHRAWQKAKMTEIETLVNIETNIKVKTELIKIIKKIAFDIETGLITRSLK